MVSFPRRCAYPFVGSKSHRTPFRHLAIHAEGWFVEAQQIAYLLKKQPLCFADGRKTRDTAEGLVQNITGGDSPAMEQVVRLSPTGHWQLRSVSLIDIMND